MPAPQETEKLQIRRFVQSFEALGIVIDFLSRKAPFDAFHAGNLITSVKYQITQNCHVAGFRGEALIGYCGWLRVTREMGEHWLHSEGALEPVVPDEADAVALTLVRVDDPDAVLPLIRACRKLEQGKRVFFRRDYTDKLRDARRSSVMNV